MFNTVALAVLVFQLTGSGLGVTGVVVAEIIPVLLLAPLADAVIDRLPAVKVMIAADVWRMGLALLLPFVADSVLAVYAVAFGLSVGAVFFDPASQATLPAVVSERELIAGNSGLWTAAVISQIVLAPLAGRWAIWQVGRCGRTVSKWPWDGQLRSLAYPRGALRRPPR